MRSPNNNILSIDLAGIPLRSPVMLAAGTAGYVDELTGTARLSHVGAIVTKSITPEPREGNPTWRIIECRAGMLNAIGLANVGIDRFLSDHAPKIANSPAPIFASIAGSTIEDYQHVASAFDTIENIPAAEVNVSCPNVSSGRSFGDSASSLTELISAVRTNLKHTKLFVKLPPVTTSAPGVSITDLATAAINAGADGLTIANSVPAMAIDPESRKPRLANTTGGLSGPAIHHITVRLVHLVYSTVARDANIPIIGVGGITTWRDAAEMILAGASAVQMGAALFADPRSPDRVAKGLARWTRKQGATNISELTGAVSI